MNKNPEHINFSEEPLTLAEVREVAKKRLSLITKEFRDGFEFLTKYEKSVTFFGSARTAPSDPYYEKAARIAATLAKDHNFSIVTGGGGGIMEAAHKGAQDVGGEAVGLTISLPHEQVTNKYVTDELAFHYFFSRKVMLSFAAEAYLFFPGGFGTMDEFFEILTLVQTKKAENIPLILVGKDFWTPLLTFFQTKLRDEYKTISAPDLDLFAILDDEEAIIKTIVNSVPRNGIRYNKHRHKGDTLLNKHCKPCEEGGEPLDTQLCTQYMDDISGWDLDDNKKLHKYFIFKNFEEAMDFVELIADIADEEGHHPDFSVYDYNRVSITLTTHAVGGLTENDFIMAAKINDAEEQILNNGLKTALVPKRETK